MPFFVFCKPSSFERSSRKWNFVGSAVRCAWELDVTLAFQSEIRLSSLKRRPSTSVQSKRHGLYRPRAAFVGAYVLDVYDEHGFCARCVVGVRPGVLTINYHDISTKY